MLSTTQSGSCTSQAIEPEVLDQVAALTDNRILASALQRVSKERKLSSDDVVIAAFNS